MNTGRFRFLLLVVLAVSTSALALCLLIVAGGKAKSYFNAREASPGFDASNLLTAQIALPETRYARADQQAQFFSQVLERVESLPGVEAAAVTTNLPFTGREAPVETVSPGY